MPKKLKKRNIKGIGDVTINDFANSSVPKNRPKKSTSSVIVALKNEVEIDKNWDDKDEEEFDGVFVAEQNEDGTVSYVIKNEEPKARRKTLSSNKESNNSNTGADYPIDIWYLISEHIRPEDVGVFAAICKTSLEVVCSAKFWFCLYRRFYQNNPTLPCALQPERLVRKYGLRKNVIRALYHMYAPFIKRIKPVTIFEEHPDCLINYDCQCLGYNVKDLNHNYFFKMRPKGVGAGMMSLCKRRSSMPDLLEMLDDVAANHDEYCRVLNVTCLGYCPVQHVIGQTLKSVTLTLSSAPKLRYHRLQLIFGPAVSNNYTTTIILDPVANLKVLDWWHPLYPTNYNLDIDLLHNSNGR